MKHLLLTFLVMLSAAAYGQDTKKTLRLITHESSPLMDSKLPGGGALVDSLRMVFNKIGYDLEVVFVSSWARAKINAKNDKTIDGYFPYATIENEDIFSFSEYFVEDPWVIVERKDNPIVWKKTEDLTKYTAGNVTGVELRPGMKELADAGKLKVENTSNNGYNLQKLINKRVDFVFIDLFTFHSEMDNNPALRPFKDKVQANAKPVIVDRYGIALRTNKENKNFLSKFNKVSHETLKFVVGYPERVKKMMGKK